MNHVRRLIATTFLLTAQAFSAAAGASDWVDAISFTYGNDDGSNETDLYRLGLQNRWERTWFKGGAWYLGGYWDAEFSYMDTELENTKYDELMDLSLTPILRYQRDPNLSNGVTPYAEAGVGPHLLSKTRLGKEKYSTALQLGSLLGIGLGFGGSGQYEIAYRYQHISNAGIKTPNDGMNLHLFRMGYAY